MDGFRLVKLNEVIRQVDIVITCTGMSLALLGNLAVTSKQASKSTPLLLYVTRAARWGWRGRGVGRESIERESNGPDPASSPY